MNTPDARRARDLKLHPVGRAIAFNARIEKRLSSSSSCVLRRKGGGGDVRTVPQDFAATPLRRHQRHCAGDVSEGGPKGAPRGTFSGLCPTQPMALKPACRAPATPAPPAFKVRLAAGLSERSPPLGESSRIGVPVDWRRVPKRTMPLLWEVSDDPRCRARAAPFRLRDFPGRLALRRTPQRRVGPKRQRLSQRLPRKVPASFGGSSPD